MTARVIMCCLAGLAFVALGCVLPWTAAQQSSVATSVAATLGARQASYNAETSATLKALETSVASTVVAYQRLLAEEAVQHQQTQSALIQAVTPAPISTSKVAPTPYYLAYATPVPLEGTGPFVVPAHDTVLMIFGSLIEPQAPIDFVVSLTLHFTVTEAEGADASTLDFSIYSPLDAGWASNQGYNKIPFGTNDIEYRFPDPYVGRDGTVALEIRNYGEQDIQVENLAVTIVARGSDGIEHTLGRPSQ